MTALTASRVPDEIKGFLSDYPIAADVKVFGGAMIVLDASGNAAPATTATGLRAVGIAEEYVDNTDGAAGAKRVKVRHGIFAFANSSAADLIAAADLHNIVYIVDDQTVAKTNGAGTRSAAGRARAIEGGMVFVELGEPALTP